MEAGLSPRSGDIVGTPRRLRRAALGLERGSALVEASVGLGIFMSILFGMISFCVYSYKLAAAQHVLFANARWAVAAARAEDSGSRVDNIKQRLQEAALTFGFALEPADIKICPEAAPDCTVDELGTNGTFTVLNVAFRVPLLPYLGARIINSRVVVRVEG